MTNTNIDEELDYTVLLCVDYDETVLKRYNELLKGCRSEGGYTQNFGYINKRSLRITQNRTIQYNLILGLGGEDAVDIARRIHQERGEVAVAFFDLKADSNDVMKAIRSVREIFPSLICGVAISRQKEQEVIHAGELFSSPSKWLYFLSDYTPIQMEQLIAHLISSFVLHHEKEKALAKNEATREKLRKILDSSPELLQNQSEEALGNLIVSQLLELTSAKNAFLLALNDEVDRFSYVTGQGRFSSADEVDKWGLLDKQASFGQALSQNKTMPFDDGVIAPLTVQGKQVGAIFLELDEEDAVIKETEVVDVFAHHAAFAIENRRFQIEIEKKRALEHELNLASRIQSSLLPKKFPEIDRLDVYGMTKSAREIGGDYFDVTSDGTNNFFSIGDVSGKGVPAGLIMSELRSIVRSFSMTDNSPKEILLKSAKLILEDIGGSGKFVSMLLFHWDGGLLRYSSAGHEHILHYRKATKTCQSYRSGGIVLGVDFRNFSRLLKEKELEWEPGDVIFLFTDGATEAKNEQGDMFTLQRLQSAVEDYAHLSASDMVNKILDEVVEFIGKAEQHDDITFLCMRYLES